MQQRQLRLGDILDDYCPRERRVTNHVVVAMIGDDVKQTRCTTCDADHEYKHARIPRQRRKQDTPAALYAQVAAAAPKRVAHESLGDASDGNGHGNGMSSSREQDDVPPNHADETVDVPVSVAAAAASGDSNSTESNESDEAPGESADEPAGEFESVHRPLIRATLPRHEGQQHTQRQAPDFTIRQPAGRPGRFRPRNARGGAQPFGGSNSNRSNGGGGYGQFSRGGPPRQQGGRPQGGNGATRPGRNRQGPPSGKRSK
jgi:hypothetical protein